MLVVLAAVLKAFPSRHTRHRGAVRREATTAPKIHARPIFRMALSEGNPKPSPQACLSTYGSWPLHLEDHVNCLHRCFTQCRINAGVPESAKSYSGTFLPLLQPTRRIWEAVGAMVAAHLPNQRSSSPCPLRRTRLRWWRVSGGCCLPPVWTGTSCWGRIFLAGSQSERGTMSKAFGSDDLCTFQCDNIWPRSTCFWDVVTSLGLFHSREDRSVCPAKELSLMAETFLPFIYSLWPRCSSWLVVRAERLIAATM